MNEMIQKAKDICALVTELEILIYNKRYDKIFNFAPKNYIVFHDHSDRWYGCRFHYDHEFITDTGIQIMDDRVSIFFNPRKRNMTFIDFDNDSINDKYDVPIPLLPELIEEEVFFQNSLVQDYRVQELYIIMAYLKDNCNIAFNLQLDDVPKMMKQLGIKHGE